MENEFNVLNTMNLVEKDRSDRISLEEAKKMTEALRQENVANFVLPLAWTFDVCDLKEVLMGDTEEPARIKIYGGIYFNPEFGKNILTLIIAGVKSDDSDIYTKGEKSIMFEYADPCPPKCGAMSTELLPADKCVEIVVTHTTSTPATCEPFGTSTCEPTADVMKTEGV